MPRNLVICCDGTANEFAVDRTNVLKLAFAATKDQDSQLLYYHPGVGTMAPAGFITSIGQFFARLAGKAFGYGLKTDILDIYSFIMNHYRSGDRLFIFGFSRGAYTARAVAALLHGYGLLGPGNDALVPYAIRLLWRANKARTDEQKAAYFQVASDFRASLSVADCRPHFLGVWDTVSSVGWIANPLSLPYTHSLPGVDIVRHAVSIDERRAFFRTNLIALDPARDMQEVWFPGVHCDVGGGYPESESGLSKIALEWMVGEAAAAGMQFDAGRVDLILGRASQAYAKPDPDAKLHNSETWPWWAAELIPKKHWNRDEKRYEWRANLFRRRTFSVSPVVDDSAWQRKDDYARRLPADAVRRSDAPAVSAQLRRNQ
jgi:uncharacterized protein (DUF2235 family)